MVDFRTDLQNRLIELITTWTGVGSDPTNYVRKIGNRLQSFDTELESPMVVVNVRSASMNDEHELGQDFDQNRYTVHIYYLDAATDLYETADARRNFILGVLEKKLKQTRTLDNLESIDDDGHREYVWGTEITDILFDSSGTEGDYSFVSELYMTVYTAAS